ncbi:fish-egg lectin-like [Centropristis striata]|uniref:fish-egg lectin-like n=1 Tax=Centropristis striata TaxID=184440 RepID=UPI0027E1012A|nr:fish-egg lectin-like [Centropristis striata]
MKAVAAVLLVLCCLAVTHAWTCGGAPNLNNAYQIEAGQGKVVARDSNYYPYFLIGSSWTRLGTTRMKHVTVGPAGLWGAGTNNRVYKYVSGNFVQSSGTSMTQLDAGGDDQLVGVSGSLAYCLRASTALTYRSGSLSWTYLSRTFRHISCSPQNGCWGVDTSYRVYHTRTMTSTCGGTSWTQVTGLSLKMVDVGTDGAVIGLTTAGQVYQRAGISSSRPSGTSWTNIAMCMTIRSLSYDLRTLWVVTSSGIIIKCTH